jgi:hypothetical protein
MTPPPVQVLQAIDRLTVNSDFQMFTKWLADERLRETEQLLSAVNPVLVHQGQGYVSALRDVSLLVTTAQQVLSNLG